MLQYARKVSVSFGVCAGMEIIYRAPPTKRVAATVDTVEIVERAATLALETVECFCGFSARSRAASR